MGGENQIQLPGKQLFPQGAGEALVGYELNIREPLLKFGINRHKGIHAPVWRDADADNRLGTGIQRGDGGTGVVVQLQNLLGSAEVNLTRRRGDIAVLIPEKQLLPHVPFCVFQELTEGGLADAQLSGSRGKAAGGCDCYNIRQLGNVHSDQPPIRGL